LYLNGGQPKTCEKSLRQYYSQLQKTGKMKAEMKDEIKNRVLVPNFNGRKHIPGKFNIKGDFIGGHIYIDSATLTDKKALELLKDQWLTEDDFKVLPEGFVPPKPAKRIETPGPKKNKASDTLDFGSEKEIKKLVRSLGLAKGNFKIADAIGLLEKHIDEN
jgi:hypothetical protein